MGNVWVVSKWQGMRYVSMSLNRKSAILRTGCRRGRLHTLCCVWRPYDTLTRHLSNSLLPMRQQVSVTLLLHATA